MLLPFLQHLHFLKPLIFLSLLFNARFSIYKPNLSSATDTLQFDPQFTQEAPVDSHVDSSMRALI